MKVCTKCKQEKSESEFFVKDKHSGRLHAQCKACYAEHRKTYHKQHYAKYRSAYVTRARNRRENLRQEFRRNMLSYLSNKSCTVCGESDIRVLEFAHIDASTKSFSVSQAVRLGFSWGNVLSEIEKCRILCANCHKRETAEEFGWYKN